MGNMLESLQKVVAVEELEQIFAREKGGGVWGERARERQLCIYIMYVCMYVCMYVSMYVCMFV
jgi:hypothetical protein